MTGKEKFEDVKCPRCSGVIEAVVTDDDQDRYTLEGLRCVKCEWFQKEIERTSVGFVWKQREEWNRREWRRSKRVQSGEALKDCSIQFDGKTLTVKDGRLGPFDSAFSLLRELATRDDDLHQRLAETGNDTARIAGEAADEITHGLSLSGYAKWNYVEPDGDEWVEDDEYWDEYMKTVWKEIERECKERKFDVEKARNEFTEDDDRPNHELFNSIADARKFAIAKTVASATANEDLPELLEKTDGIIQEILDDAIRAHAKDLLDKYVAGGRA